MRKYPTSKDEPNRKQRKAKRRVIFAENKQDSSLRRKDRREAKKVVEGVK